MSGDGALIEAAAETLYGVAASGFTAERKRLADELKAAGARKAAAAVAKLPKPTTSAWVINQLQRAGALARWFAASARVRAGDAAAASEQRAALTELRERAAAVLATDGHAVTPAVLQRITTTLQALAAIGSFAPDAPGRLLVDRDPPGFDAMVGVTLAMPARAPADPPAAAAPVVAPGPALVAIAPAGPTPAELRARAEERARRERVAAAARQTATDRRVELRQLRAELTLAEAAVLRARERLATAEAALVDAEAEAQAATAALAEG